MARKGEVADIVSQKQYDYFLKQAQSAMPKLDRHLTPLSKDGKPLMRNNPLDARGQARNALRDKTGKIIKPGGGKADDPPSVKQALQALAKFHNSGGRRSQLPKVSTTKDAYKARQQHPQMRKDQMVKPSVRPRGSSEYERQRLRQSGSKPRKGKYVRTDEGGWEYMTPSQRTLSASKEYLSKSINEEFGDQLNKALGF